VKILKRHFGNFAVLQISGKMAESMETSGLFDIIRDLVQDGVYYVIIDMKEIEWINSTGVGALMGCYSYLDSHHGELILVHTPDRVKNVLLTMDLLPYFRQFPSVNKAIIASQHL
jgi:anti-sigma B factor antagonist